MAQIRIKRSTGSSAPSSSSLANAELAFAEGNDILYYGEGTSGSNAASVIKIGGSGAFVALEGNQTVGGNKTFTGDVALKNLTVTGTTTFTVEIPYGLTTSGNVSLLPEVRLRSL